MHKKPFVVGVQPDLLGSSQSSLDPLAGFGERTGSRKGREKWKQGERKYGHLFFPLPTLETVS